MLVVDVRRRAELAVENEFNHRMRPAGVAAVLDDDHIP
jgi:hypothetical protein